VEPVGAVALVAPGSTGPVDPFGVLVPLVPFNPGTFGPSPAAGFVACDGEVPADSAGDAPLAGAGIVM
jgi:hypothetical protein